MHQSTDGGNCREREDTWKDWGKFLVSVVCPSAFVQSCSMRICYCLHLNLWHLTQKKNGHKEIKATNNRLYFKDVFKFPGDEINVTGGERQHKPQSEHHLGWPQDIKGTQRSDLSLGRIKEGWQRRERIKEGWGLKEVSELASTKRGGKSVTERGNSLCQDPRIR